MTNEPAAVLMTLLGDIALAEAQARQHDLIADDRDLHAAAAQCADERAEASRRAARRLIEARFPGVSWSMIARAAL